ncbi:MAG TPA: hypothetical protein VGF45_11480, partial [Polyangia bacterium]
MTDKTPPPVTVDPGDLPERRRRARAIDTTPPPEPPPSGAAAIAAWDAEFPFEGATELVDLPELPGAADVNGTAEPPPPDSDLVLDVSDETPTESELPTPGPEALAAGETTAAESRPSRTPEPPAAIAREVDVEVDVDVDVDVVADESLGNGAAYVGHARSDNGKAEALPEAPAARARVIPVKGDAFDGELPTETRTREAARLDLGFGPLVAELDARAIAARMSDFKAPPADSSNADAQALAHELAEALEGSATPVEIATLAVAAGRAVEGSNPEEALGHYRQALAVEPGHAPALRARLRLELRRGTVEAALAAVAGLADAVPPDQRAYQALLDEAVNSGMPAPNLAGVDSPSEPHSGTGEGINTAKLLRLAEAALRGEGDTAAACERLGDHLGGAAQVALRTFAAMLRQLDGQVPALDALT